MKKRAIITILGVALLLGGVLYTQRATPPTAAITSVKHPESQQKAFLTPTNDTPMEFTPMQSPVQLTIPSLHITSAVKPVGREANNDMALPNSLTESGWYKDGAMPGNPGKAVIAAHTGYPHKPSQFRRLEQLQVKDTFTVTDTSGTTATFEIIHTATYRPTEAPLDSIFGDSPTPRLALITCAGEWQPETQSYSHRLVLFAVRQK
jgi:sortase A